PLRPAQAVARGRQADRLLLAGAGLVDAGVIHEPDALVDEDVHVVDVVGVEGARRAALEGHGELLPAEQVARHRVADDPRAGELRLAVEPALLGEQVIVRAVADDRDVAEGEAPGCPQHGPAHRVSGWSGGMPDGAEVESEGTDRRAGEARAADAGPGS